MSLAQLLILVPLLTPLLATASDPRDFGRAELRQAFAERKLASTQLAESIEPGTPEAWSLAPGKVTGSDSRGVLYGLLEAAEQIRKTGRITAAKGAPKTLIRGIRYFLHNADLERDWYYSKEYWDEYLSMLARNRFNRFNLVFAHQTDYLAPPYPFWIDLPEFPTIRAKNLTPAQREKNLETLRYIAQGAVARGIDFTLGVWEHNIQDYRTPPMIPMTEGLTDDNIGPYSYAALKKILQLVPEISSVQMRTNNESGINTTRQVDFYKNYVFKAIKDAGRPVILDLRGWIVAGGMVKAADEVGIPVRLSTKYWAEDTGRPYQPAETYANYSYLNFLEKPRSYKFYWELWGLGSHRLLLWGDPEHVRRAVSTFGLAGSEGFEIDPPLAQKGFGNAPGRWGIFTDSQSRRAFWKWEFQRYWLFYQLWGRLSYDPATPAMVWEDELRRRFGAAASDVMSAYASASQVLNEIVAVHLADPNMYIWPEINPGGLTDAYREVQPGDWRYVASIPEAVDNRLTGKASAKQTPDETARRLDEMARRTEEAVTRARKRIGADNREWLSTEPDLLVLAAMARYHAHKQRGTYLLAYFDRTRDESVLPEARREFEGGLDVWKKLVALTTDLYPRQMAFGPDDNGHWADKLPYVQHDLQLVAQRENLAKRLGRFDLGFDFGGPLKRQTSRSAHRADNYILRNTEAPGFTAIDPATRYSDQTGYGWLSDGPREANVIPLIPLKIARAVTPNPQELPGDVLYSDSIRGTGAQLFAVKLKAGDYRVLLLRPDGGADEMKLKSLNGRLAIPMPEGAWNISGIVIKAQGATAKWPPPHATKAPRGPSIRHSAPASVRAGTPLSLEVQVSGAPKIRTVRLHYRAVNQMTAFKMLEAAPGAKFTIPAEDIQDRWDLMYYFEVIDDQQAGWFHPDPLRETPYYVVTVIR
jgi:hypothetical protein